MGDMRAFAVSCLAVAGCAFTPSGLAGDGDAATDSAVIDGPGGPDGAGDPDSGMGIDAAVIDAAAIDAAAIDAPPPIDAAPPIDAGDVAAHALTGVVAYEDRRQLSNGRLATAIELRAARAISLSLIADADGAVLATTITGDNGRFALDVPKGVVLHLEVSDPAAATDGDGD